MHDDWSGQRGRKNGKDNRQFRTTKIVSKPQHSSLFQKRRCIGWKGDTKMLKEHIHKINL